MNGFQNLDDPNQTVFYIPFTDDGKEDETDDVPLPRSLYYERDLPGGEKIRIDAYTKAWKKCLDRVKSIIQALRAPIATEVVQEVHASYNDILPGLPYPELPVISITNPTSGSSFLEQITFHTDSSNLDDADSDTAAFTTHLYPGDCVNLTSSMKAMISGFTDRTHILEKVKGRAGTSLANYDIETLVAWYTAVRETYGLHEKCQPKLVVLLHDFEQLDPIVIQDVFNISSLYVSRLPLVFIIVLSSPSSPSYLHSTYPRSTLALLRVRNYTVPSGAQVLEEVITKTFFDVEFDPDIMIGPSVLTILADHYNRHDPSMDTALNILHLAHLKHFSAEPLTVLTTSTPSSNTLAHDASSPFTDALLTRLQPTTSGPSASDLSQRRLVSLISSVDDARTLFYSRARRLRIGFGILKLVQAFMTNQGYKGLNWAHQPGGMGILDVMNDALRGKLGSDIKYLGTMVRKLRTVQLEALLEAIHAYFHDMPSDVRSREEQARTKIVLSMNALRQREESVGEADSQAAASFGEWLVDYMNNLLTPLEESILWEVWYTGLSPFPIDLINPSLRASVIAGLLQPHDFADKEEGDDERSNFSLWELPDTSILFHRYLDSGRMINLYDWFESFRLELETQREKLKSRAKSRPRSPTKRSKKGTAKAVDEPEEKDEETWKLEVQARFMRALQELDYLGFIKHTGRKADHVQRVVFDIRD